MEEEDQGQKETGKGLLEVYRAQPQLQLRRPRLQPEMEEKLVLQFMDSMHNYLALFDALFSTLRQGWLDLASARHSMGGSRVNISLLDMKFHSASTSVKIAEYDADSIAVQPCFMLRKWVSSEHGNSGLEDNDVQLHESNSILQSSAEENAEVTVSKNLSGPTDNDQFHKERSKSLSVFGILISPKLRATQLSFERGGLSELKILLPATLSAYMVLVICVFPKVRRFDLFCQPKFFAALETLVEIANMQSSLLCSFHQLQGVEDDKR